MELSKELKLWRIERPSEWKMDEFIRKAEQLEKGLDRAVDLLDDKARAYFLSGDES